MAKQVILSGMRPSGKLHLGHLVGVLENWKRLQETYICYFEVADLHALTTEYKNTQEIRTNTLEMVKDWIAVGIDPKKATLFVQSEVKEHTELHLYFSMLVSLSRLLRNPTFKEYIADLQAKELRTSRKRLLEDVATRTIEKFLAFVQSKEFKPEKVGEKQYQGVLKAKLKDQFVEAFSEGFVASDQEELSYGHLVNYGFLGYPVLQAADILLYKGELVPVGEDQVPHIELTREIARRFNQLYKKVFPEPKPLLTEFPRVPGTDGKRMSKSRGNTILISETPESLRKKIRSMFTDPEKIRKGDPGHPERCPVFALHRIFNREETPQIEKDCRSGALGCVECKLNLTGKVEAYLTPIWERRAALSDDQVVEILQEGTRRAREKAQETMQEVRDALGLF